MLTWIGHHNEGAVRTVFDNLRDDVFENVDVPLHQVQSALTLLLTHSGRHHHDTRVSGHRIVCRSKKKKPTVNIHYPLNFGYLY